MPCPAPIEYTVALSRTSPSSLGSARVCSFQPHQTVSLRSVAPSVAVTWRMPSERMAAAMLKPPSTAARFQRWRYCSRVALQPPLSGAAASLLSVSCRADPPPGAIHHATSGASSVGVSGRASVVRRTVPWE